LSGSAARYARAVVADRPIAYWQFDDAAGSHEYADSSDHGNALPAGLTSLGKHTQLISTAVGGTQTTSALDPLVGDATRTVEIWFRTTSDGCILTAGAAGHAQAFSLCLRVAALNSPVPGTAGFYLATWDADIFAPVLGMTDGRWHYVAITLTGRFADLVVDGRRPPAYVWNRKTYSVLTAQPITLPYTPDTAPGPLGIGTKGVGDLPGGVSGAIAEVAVYPRALPVSDLINHYRLLTGGTSPLTPESGAAQAPAAPVHIAVTPLSQYTMRVTWSDSADDAAGYYVSNGCGTNGCRGGALNERTGRVTAADFVTTPGAYQCFFVQAFNSSGTSAWAGPS
jgi:hypothetical protein